MKLDSRPVSLSAMAKVLLLLGTLASGCVTDAVPEVDRAAMERDVSRCTAFQTGGSSDVATLECCGACVRQLRVAASQATDHFDAERRWRALALIAGFIVSALLANAASREDRSGDRDGYRSARTAPFLGWVIVPALLFSAAFAMVGEGIIFRTSFNKLRGADQILRYLQEKKQNRALASFRSDEDRPATTCLDALTAAGRRSSRFAACTDQLSTYDGFTHEIPSFTSIGQGASRQSANDRDVLAPRMFEDLRGLLTRGGRVYPLVETTRPPPGSLAEMYADSGSGNPFFRGVAIERRFPAGLNPLVAGSLVTLLAAFLGIGFGAFVANRRFRRELARHESDLRGVAPR